MKTVVVNLFGGPGVGKSTLGAELFVRFKQCGVSCEMIQEYVKGWAWEGRKVGPLDQVYILAKQLKMESRLYGKVDLIITDSPLLMSPIYERFYQNTGASEPMAMTILKTAVDFGVEHVNFFLGRHFAYTQDGRYEDEAMAKKVDTWIRTFLDFHRLPYRAIEQEENAINVIAGVVKKMLDKPEQLPLMQSTIPAPPPKEPTLDDYAYDGAQYQA